MKFLHGSRITREPKISLSRVSLLSPQFCCYFSLHFSLIIYLFQQTKKLPLFSIKSAHTLLISNIPGLPTYIFPFYFLILPYNLLPTTSCLLSILLCGKTVIIQKYDHLDTFYSPASSFLMSLSPSVMFFLAQ